MARPPRGMFCRAPLLCLAKVFCWCLVKHWWRSAVLDFQCHSMRFTTKCVFWEDSKVITRLESPISVLLQSIFLQHLWSITSWACVMNTLEERALSWLRSEENPLSEYHIPLILLCENVLMHGSNQCSYWCLLRLQVCLLRVCLHLAGLVWLKGAWLLS